MLKESKAPNYSPSYKAMLKDLPTMFAELIRKMTIFNPN